MFYSRFSTPLLLLLALSCSAFSNEHNWGAVASPDQYGASVAEQIMRQGGNAIDAAVATAFTLAVTYPEAATLIGLLQNPSLYV